MTVKELYEKVVNGIIISDIELQRAIVYDADKQALVIDSIYNGIPLPAFYLWQREDGKLEVNNLYIGKYKIVEKKAPDGYILEEKDYFVDITSDNHEVSINIPNKHEEIIVPNTSLNNNNYLKYSSFSILLLGFTFIIWSKKRTLFK